MSSIDEQLDVAYTIFIFRDLTLLCMSNGENPLGIYLIRKTNQVRPTMKIRN